MKKIISLLLALMLAASLCACGGSDTPANSSSEEKGAETAAAEADEGHREKRQIQGLRRAYQYIRIWIGRGL